MMQVAGEYHDRGLQLKQTAEADLCHLAGAESALVVSSFDAALHAVLASVAANREVVLAGPATMAHGMATDWPKLAARHGVILHTIGGEAPAVAGVLAV
jgi:seryl-tRNA(Sec) selenium transferase